MRRAALLIACLVLAAAARAQAPQHAPERMPHPSQVSFADMVRLSAGAPLAPRPAATQAAVRVTRAQAPEAAEPRFSIRPVREPARWLLVLSGLALAGWVAHRRLVNPL